MNSGENLRDIILLDSDLSAIIFCKKRLVDNAFNSKDSVLVGATRDSNLKLNKKHIALLFKEKHWFNEDLISNIFLLTNIVDNYHITIDTAVDYAFCTHFLNKILKFR